MSESVCRVPVAAPGGRRSGSALLIVLGFLSFMVVSAVAFAIYMRSERVPSSALRQGVATRHLVKAAVAQAMSRVDDAVRAHPFPGMIDTNSQSSVYGQNGCAYDWWTGRVFMPPDPDGTTVSGNLQTRYAPINQTVSVLNLEALGYLPPGLVNDVRFLSRSSWAAKWDYFNFDAGRFAYCVVNVSDYFDINLISGDGIRTSAPDGRVSFAHLFRGTSTKYDNVSESTLKAFLELKNQGGTGDRPVDSGTPFVSLLDYNLALWAKGAAAGIGGNIWSPFGWVASGDCGNSSFFYDSAIREDAKVVGAARQVFVTDSKPATQNKTASVSGASGNEDGWACVDLTNLNKSETSWDKTKPSLYGQPFKTVDMKGGESATKILSDTSNLPFWMALLVNGKASTGLNILGLVDVLTLYDYLDRDSVPTCLAAPCVEKTPMVASVEPAFRLHFPLESSAQPQRIDGFPTAAQPFKLESQDVTIKGANVIGGIRAGIVFPFRRAKKFLDQGNYSVQAVSTVFLAPKGVNLRLADDNNLIYPKNKVQAFWDKTTPDDAYQLQGQECFAATGRSQPIRLSGGSEIDTEEDALLKVSGDLITIQWPQLQDRVFCRVVTKTPQKATIVNGVTTWEDNGAPEKLYEVVLKPLDAGGKVSTAFDVASETYGNLKLMTQVQFDGLKTGEYQLYAAVWARILNSNGDTVDMVPAGIWDDAVNDHSAGAAGEAILRDVTGPTVPLLRFASVKPDGGSFLTFENILEKRAVTKLPEGDIMYPKAFCTVDPRFNYAPEDWFGVDNVNGEPGQAWLNAVNPGKNGGAWEKLGTAGRDSDLFMFVSDQGYLQSVGELAFLPRLYEPETSGSALLGGGGSGAFDGVERSLATVGSMPNSRCMWRSHRLYTVDGAEPDDLYGSVESKVSITDGQSHLSVNPYSADNEIFAAALVNTPYDWWAAGTNDLADTQNLNTYDKTEKKAMLASFNKAVEHAFVESSAFGAGSELKSDALNELCTGMSSVFRAGAASGKSWQTVYDEWDWDRNVFSFAGSKAQAFGQDLYGVDRKYLYAYWRSCFASSQQLFLIFVRAESNALGGTGEGTPAQKGGRAVALVWRDAASQPQSNDQSLNYEVNRQPHRMRVLFYHQFE